MKTDADTTIATAIDWHLRQGSMGEDDWVCFVAWLEQDPSHARAYDRIAADDRIVAQAAFQAAAVAAPSSSLRRWAWAGAGAAIAASLVVVLMPLALHTQDSTYSVRTRAGERREVALADGTRIDLNGATHMVLDRHDARTVTLAAGEATFHVAHDAAAPFTVRSGTITIRDLGTIFNVARDGGRLGVQVASGSVLFQPGADAVVLKAGDAIIVREDLHRVTLSHVAPQDVGGWRDGHLAFSGEPLGVVFAAVSRRYGTQITLGPDLSDRPFTGMVTLDGSADRDIPHLAALIGARARREGGQWIIASSSARAR